MEDLNKELALHILPPNICEDLNILTGGRQIFDSTISTEEYLTIREYSWNKKGYWVNVHDLTIKLLKSKISNDEVTNNVLLAQYDIQMSTHILDVLAFIKIQKGDDYLDGRELYAVIDKFSEEYKEYYISNIKDLVLLINELLLLEAAIIEGTLSEYFDNKVIVNLEDVIFDEKSKEELRIEKAQDLIGVIGVFEKQCNELNKVSIKLTRIIYYLELHLEQFPNKELENRYHIIKDLHLTRLVQYNFMQLKFKGDKELPQQVIDNEGNITIRYKDTGSVFGYIHIDVRKCKEVDNMLMKKKIDVDISVSRVLGVNIV